MSLLDQADGNLTPARAARLRDKWARELSNHTGSEEHQGELNDAIGTLHARFPEVEDVPFGGGEAYARSLGAKGPSATSTKPDAQLLEKGAAAAAPAAGKSGGTAGKSGGEGKSAGSAKRGRSKGRSGGRVSAAKGYGRRSWRQTGIPGGASSASEITMSALGATVGLSAAYLVLTSSESAAGGVTPLVQLLNGITGFLRRFIAPVDVLGGALKPGDFSDAITPAVTAPAGGPAGPQGPIGTELPYITPKAAPRTHTHHRKRR